MAVGGLTLSLVSRGSRRFLDKLTLMLTFRNRPEAKLANQAKGCVCPRLGGINNLMDWYPLGLWQAGLD